MNPGIKRPSYKPSARVDGIKLLPALGLLGLGSAGIAAVFYGLLAGSNLIAGFSVPIVIFTVLLIIIPAIRLSHCRNQTLAGVLGVACGLAGYLGYFHLDQCFRWEVSLTAINRLPDYLAFRMETDQWEAVWKAMVLRPQKPAAGIQPFRPLAQTQLWSWNWAGFFFDAGLFTLVGLAVGVVTAGRPYSEKLKRWCGRELLVMEPHAGQGLRKALHQGTVGAWVDARPRKAEPGQPHCKISVWYTPAGPDMTPDPDMFLAFGWGKPVCLSPEEGAALAQLLPAMVEMAGSAQRELAQEAEQAQDPTSARIWPVPSPYAGWYQNPRTRFLEKAVFWVLHTGPPLLAGAILMGGTYILINFFPMAEVVIVGYVVGVGILVLMFLRLWFNPDELKADALTRRFGFDLLCRALACRPDALVAVDDSRVVFAKMLPRRLWLAQWVKTQEYNSGLLVVDTDRQLILFEGDLQRYWMPAAAIQGCDLENTTFGEGTTATPYAVVLQVRLGSGTWELPFIPLANIEGANNWERAMALHGRIKALFGRTVY